MEVPTSFNDVAASDEPLCKDGLSRSLGSNVLTLVKLGVGSEEVQETRFLEIDN